MMPTNPDPDLMRIFDFTAADLEANRAGRVTEHQADNQYKLLKGHNMIFLVSAIALPVVCLLMMALTGAFNSSSPLNKQTGFWIVALLSMSAMLITVVIKNNRNMTADVHADIACCESGRIKRWTGRGEGYLKISYRELTLYESQNNDLKRYLKNVPKETLFRIYYVPKSKRILSMEIISS